MKIMLANQSTRGRSEAVSGQRLLNLYAELNPEGSKYPYTLYGTPGVRDAWGSSGSGGQIQGMQVMGDNLYVISSNTVSKITLNSDNSILSTTSIGSITGTLGRVDLANNGTQMIAVTVDGLVFVITSASVAAVTFTGGELASSATFLDGYIILTRKDTAEFYISALYDATTYTALDYATAEESPDNLVRATAFNGALWLFGKTSYEVYYNSGNSDFPFEQIPGAANTTKGLAARDSVAQDDNTIIFLGSDNIVYKMVGYSPQRISTSAVEHAINSYTIGFPPGGSVASDMGVDRTIADAYAFIYTQSGHKFYVLTFPTNGETWVYDLSNGLWHNRATYGSDIWRYSHHAFFANQNIVGGDNLGGLFMLDLDQYQEGSGGEDESIERIVEGSVQWADGQRLIYDRVRLDIDAGVGLNDVDEAGGDPQVMMQFSDDGGKTWSNESWRSMGRVGEYSKQLVWRRLGSARERIFRFKIKDLVKVAITGAYADVRVCPA